MADLEDRRSRGNGINVGAHEFNRSGIVFGNYEVVADQVGKPVFLGEGSFGKT